MLVSYCLHDFLDTSCYAFLECDMLEPARDHHGYGSKHNSRCQASGEGDTWPWPWLSAGHTFFHFAVDCVFQSLIIFFHKAYLNPIYVNVNVYIYIYITLPTALPVQCHIIPHYLYICNDVYNTIFHGQIFVNNVQYDFSVNYLFNFRCFFVYVVYL